MGSVRGFRCQRCCAEVLAADPERVGRPGWAPPVLCCGEPLRPLAPDQVLTGILVGALARGRLARCPRCGYRVRLVVHPAGPLVCLICQKEFEIAAREAVTGNESGVTAATPGGEEGPAAPESSGVLQAGD